MATCKNCFHYEACSGFKPTDLDKDVWHYCQMGIPEEIPDIDQRCDSFKDRKSWVEVVRCKDCKHYIAEEKERCEAMRQTPYGLCIKHRCLPLAGYYEYRNEDDFCSYGERKDND